MDFHVLGAKGDHHIMTTHRGEADETPLQLISSARLEYLLALEMKVRAYADTTGNLLAQANRAADLIKSG